MATNRPVHCAGRRLSPSIAFTKALRAGAGVGIRDSGFRAEVCGRTHPVSWRLGSVSSLNPESRIPTPVPECYDASPALRQLVQHVDSSAKGFVGRRIGYAEM